MLQIVTRSATFRAGQTVRYFSTGLGCWVTASVKSFNQDGSMNLDEARTNYSPAWVQLAQVRIDVVVGLAWLSMLRVSAVAFVCKDV